MDDIERRTDGVRPSPGGEVERLRIDRDGWKATAEAYGVAVEKAERRLEGAVDALKDARQAFGEIAHAPSKVARNRRAKAAWDDVSMVLNRLGGR